LAAATAPPDAAELAGEAQATAAFVAVRRTTGTGTGAREGRSRRFTRARLAAVAVGVLLVLTGSMAAFGALPGAAQSVAQDVLGVIGIHVPGPNAHAGDHPFTRGKSSEHRPTPFPTPHATPGGRVLNGEHGRPSGVPTPESGHASPHNP
jgi:hypothetical protein